MSAQHDLPCAAFEVHSAASRFTNTTLLRGAQATRERVLAALPQAWLVHFCCHGDAYTDNPLASALHLAANRPLTLASLLDTRLERCRLVMLSACETAVIGTQLIDETISLQSALLQAGAAAAIATAWAVYDTSAALLVARFYAEWRGPDAHPPHRALQLAQQWLRDSTNDEKLEWLERNAPAAELAPLLRDELRQAVREAGAGGRSHAALLHWAGFAYAGA
ncbi:CHAT domain-containing protein [Sphaerotilus microaerophilus]|uniref:CHAT domain-containing protein n=1 Tax=Sphaerotilus microaerophilus TaxID=2914710 RepID=A0ABN6PNY7_9BURK|nr:CHAT domain-containing protein [Sphaerotilus sp. FB-5]BDI06323.1 hypothetical protein CATMQ487_32930 [Sphaerotilus sp. FB-5]